GRALDVVADGMLMDLPFAALREPTTGRAVAELSALRLVSHPLSERSASPLRPSALALLAISDPVLTPTLAESLPPLPGARTETHAISSRFHEADILEGSEATREAVLSDLSGRQVLHVAAHVVAHRDLSGAAAVLLAGEVGNNWRADDIAGRQFQNL